MKKLSYFLLSLTLFGCSSPASSTASYQRMSMNEAYDYMQKNDDYILLDVRTESEYDQGYIPGAINIPNEVIETDNLEQLPDKEQTILVYCRSGNRSKQASAKLVKRGYTNIIEIGGINDYSGEISSNKKQ